MKNFRLLFCGFIIATMTVISCSDDDAGSSVATQAPITGKWYYSQQGQSIGGQDFLTNYTMHTPGCSKDNIVFGADNSYRRNEYEDGNCQEISAATTYSISNNIITIGSGFDSEVYEIESVTANTLRLRQAETVGGETEYWVETFTKN
ncbi:MAG: lipocalin family protein [Flavobacterium sp.]